MLKAHSSIKTIQIINQVMKKVLPIFLLLMLFCSCSNKDDYTITSISIDKTKLELKIGESYDFQMSHFPSEAPSPRYKWVTSKYFPINGPEDGYEIASIDQNGTIKALKEGVTIVSVETIDVFDPEKGYPFFQSCEVTIKPIVGESITLSKTDLDMKPGETASLTYTISPDNATSKDVIWKTSDPKVASISYGGFTSNAEITAKGQGEATITVSLKDNPKVSATCKVKVGAEKLESISFEEKEKTIMQGESTKLNLVFTPSYATNKNVQWTSSNKDIAVVDKEGNVTGVHFGECTITAKAEDGGFETACKVIVKPIPVENISFPSRYYDIEIGGEKQLIVNFTPENAGNRNLTWSSSNPIAVSIDKTGKVKGNTSGSSTITATSEDGGHKASVEIYVVEIDRLMNVYFPSSSVVILNGYYTGSISCAIRNNSSHAVNLSKFYVVESNTYKTVLETTDMSILGELKPGETKTLNARLNSVYEPIFRWEFEYNGNSYSTWTKYGDK
jgi:uncharacterized protein YjdB